ncbi:MAG: hypothetical protein ACOX4J_09685 [Anaerovoracaceae bacterium]
MFLEKSEAGERNAVDRQVWEWKRALPEGSSSRRQDTSDDQHHLVFLVMTRTRDCLFVAIDSLNQIHVLSRWALIGAYAFHSP